MSRTQLRPNWSPIEATGRGLQLVCSEAEHRKRPPSGGGDADGHVWSTKSRHRTSEGMVRYQRCPCGLWRVRLGQDRMLADHIGGASLAVAVRNQDEGREP
jgi:hypothetical protein